MLPHDPGYLLMVDDPSLTMELFGNPSVPIPREFQAEISNAINKGLLRGFMFWRIIISSSWELHQLAPPLNAFDKGAILGNEASLFSACLRLFRKAFLGTRFQG